MRRLLSVALPLVLVPPAFATFVSSGKQTMHLVSGGKVTVEFPQCTSDELRPWGQCYAHSGFRGDPSTWVTTDDYPPRARRENRAGVVYFRLTPNAVGRANDCKVVRSSGEPLLDEAACVNLKRRARFRPEWATLHAAGIDGRVNWVPPWIIEQ